MRIGDQRSQGVEPSLQGWRAAARAGQPGTGGQDALELSPEAQREVEKLEARDREVRAHEAAHMAAGGSLVRGGASFTYQQGPDGKRYAVGGEVGLDAGPVPDDPQATIAKASRIRAAALAPAEPSGQDRAVAARASAMASRAAAELARQESTPEGEGPVAPRFDVIA